MQLAGKSIKSAAKEAKQRLKSRFWEEYKKEVQNGVKIAGTGGLASTGIKRYFKAKVERKVRGTAVEDEKFYATVKEMLDKYGKPSDALDRLMDKRYFGGLSYEEKERYLFRLADRYLRAVERYDRERAVEAQLRVR